MFSPAYREDEFEELLSLCRYNLVFELLLPSFEKTAPGPGRWEKRPALRIDPECSTQEGHAIYDPCAPGSRLGTTLEQFEEELLPLLDGLRCHTLCEQDSDDLETTAEVFEKKFGKYLYQMKWVNFGGGHHITRKDYDVERLLRIVRHFHEHLWCERPVWSLGKPWFLNAGYLVTSVLETLYNGMDLAILAYLRSLPHAGCSGNALSSAS